MNLNKKLGTALLTSALVLSAIAPAAFADSEVSTGNTSSSTKVSNSGNSNFFGSRFPFGGGFPFNNNNNGMALKTVLTGAQEAPGPGDPNGFGTAKIRVQPNRERVCVTLRVGNIQTASAAHIHEAPIGVAGPVVVSLPTPDQNGYAKGCIDTAEAGDIAENPENYYVNVHNAEYPNGAVRGQLSN